MPISIAVIGGPRTNGPQRLGKRKFGGTESPAEEAQESAQGMHSAPSAPTPETPSGGSASIEANPAAVAFRSEAETCGKCQYMSGNMCSHPMVAQEVQAGDSCLAFSPKGGMEEMAEMGHQVGPQSGQAEVE